MIPYELFGCIEGFDEDKVKKNISLYRQYAVGGVPSYWRKESVMDEWNTLIRRFCNELPEGAEALSKGQMLKMHIKYLCLLVKDSVGEV